MLLNSMIVQVILNSIIYVININFIGHSATVWNGKFQRNNLQAVGVAVKKVTCRSNILFDFTYHFNCFIH